MIKTTECYLCGGIEQEPAGLAVGVSSEGRPMVASLCTEECVKKQAEASEAAFDAVDIVRLGYGFPHEVVYGGLEVWLHDVTVEGRKRFDPEVIVEVKCAVCENYTELPVHKNAVGRYIWPGTTQMFNGGALYPYNVFADGRKNPRGGMSIKGFAACSHGCATIMATESAFRPDGSMKRVLALPRLVNFADVYGNNRLGFMSIATGVQEYEPLFKRVSSLLGDQEPTLWEGTMPSVEQERKKRRK